MHICDREQNPYFITLNELKEQLLIIKEKNFTIHKIQPSNIHLTGGDPLTHPQFFEICELINKILPHFTITVSTNGLLLNKFSDEQLNSLSKKLKVTFQLSLYPKLSLLKMYEKLQKRFESLDLNLTFFGGSHFYFSKQEKTTFKNNSHKDYSIQCSTLLNNQNHIIFFKDGIFSCWKDINILQKEPWTNIDYLKINQTKKNQELMQNCKHMFCDICKKNNGSGGLEYILWNNHYKYSELIFLNNLKELYVNYYNIYYELQHEYNDYKDILKSSLFQSNLSKQQAHYANTRYLNGLGDIFIPFDNYLSTNLKDFLSNFPDINKYNIYFISFTDNKIIEDQNFSLFLPFDGELKLNTYFLKANSKYFAYKTFLENSYLNNKFYIDLTLPYFTIKKLQ